MHTMKKLLLLYTCIIILGCGRKLPENQEVVLARVGDRDITVTEFLRRAEYTIRPPYVKMNSYIHKKIILNSLIAEKMMALEEGEDNPILNHEPIQLYLQGRQEQAMRKWLYRVEGLEKVKMNKEKFSKVYAFAGREYEINYYTVHDTTAVHNISRKLANDVTFEDIYGNRYGPVEIPKRLVAWDKEGNDAIHKALFTDSLKVGQVIGPIKADDETYITMKILGWIDRPAVTEVQKMQRKSDVEDLINRQESYSLYNNFASRVMRRKKVEFSRDTFFKFAQLLQPQYMLTPELKEEVFNEKFWNNKDMDLVTDVEKDLYTQIKTEPILDINGDVWTVKDLQHEIVRHPLVFRKRKMSNSEFPEQLKLAIVDLIRDKYLTEIAYKRGYDQLEPVIREKHMWQDYLVALYQKDQYLKSIGETRDFATEYMKIIDDKLNVYVDSLQNKYSNRIYIDTDVFEKIKVTRLDMFVKENNVPFPITVPSFPVLTTDTRLDYGQKMNQKKE
ncbi:hypothetical protein JW935_06590 [candidate division KSB1 bacterium]|nr:hypothetical protein [candidate division KSB1 bacterium]